MALYEDIFLKEFQYAFIVILVKVYLSATCMVRCNFELKLMLCRKYIALYSQLYAVIDQIFDKLFDLIFFVFQSTIGTTMVAALTRVSLSTPSNPT